MADIMYFRGKAKWAKIIEPDLDYDKTKKSWKIDLYMDDKSWLLYDQSGIQLKVRSTDEGKYVQFRRPTLDWSGNVVGPPIIIDSAGNDIGVKVGNGSTVVCKVEVYKAKKGKGHRLLAVQVEDLVEYNKSEVFNPDNVVPF